MERPVPWRDFVFVPMKRMKASYMDRKEDPNSTTSANSRSLGALLAIFAILGLAGYFIIDDHKDFVVKPATGTAQAMAAVATK